MLNLKKEIKKKRECRTNLYEYSFRYLHVRAICNYLQTLQ